MSEARSSRGVRLVPGGIVVGSGPVEPLLVASVHYWRLEPSEWRTCLEAVRALGFRFVDTYVPWGVHELAPGRFDFGESDARLDVARFLGLAAEVGLRAIVRPGPHINAELTWFGIPERIVWEPGCQAKGPSGAPVVLPMLPLMFPVPSYASLAFFDEASRWLRAAARVLSPLRYPDGPIVLVQVDNEGALYFRDGAFDQDYGPDAVAQYRDFVREKYKTLEALAAAYGAAVQPGEAPRGGGEAARELTFATLEPPRRFAAKAPADVAWYADWSEFHERLLDASIERFAGVLEDAGLGGLPLSHNLPPGQDATPLNAARLSWKVDLVGLDYYQDASPTSFLVSLRRTTELATRAEASGVPAFAAEMGAGFPPFFPPLDEGDSLFTLLTAMAFGLRAWNLYMAVDRDRWIGAPIDPHGRPRPFAESYRKLLAALERTRFHELRRATPVRLLLPRSERRLQRVMHAFGPMPGTFFSVTGSGAKERCLEDDLGLGWPVALEAERFLHAFENALLARGVPFAHVGGEDREAALRGASWVVCASSGGLHRGLFEHLASAASGGARVTLGPHVGEAIAYDGAFREHAESLRVERLRAPGTELALRSSGDPAEVEALVSRAIVELALPTYAVGEPGLYATVHADASGAPRVVFVLNPTDADVVARVSVGAVTKAEDALEGAPVAVLAVGPGRADLELLVRAGSVRMIAVS